MLSEGAIYPLVLWGAFNLALMVLLGINVSRMRIKTGVIAGTGDNAELERAMRAHGNNIEYVPGLLVGMVLLALVQSPVWLLHTVGGVLFLGRLLQADGMLRVTEGPPLTRAAGNLLTWILYVVTVVALLYELWS